MGKSNNPTAGFYTLALVGAFALLSSPPVLAADDEVMEEVVVTGSYIRRDDSFDTANPLDVLSSTDLDETGTPNLGEVFRQQSFNYGVDSVTNILAAIPNTGTFTQANVRGLGAGATLQLLNGRRTANPNVQTLYPIIALDRVETLTDGGAALYGTDAVAGVVNMIPRRRMEGVEVRTQYNFADDWDETMYSIMVGTSSGQSSMSAALQWREREELRMFDRKSFANAAVSASGEGNPGSFLTPVRDATGAYMETRALPDPGCGLNNEGFGTDSKLEENNFRTGFLFTPVPARFQVAQPCRREFGEDHQYISPQEILNGATFFEHQFNDLVSFDAEMLFSRQETFHRSSASNPGGRVQSLPTIRGEHPGNPYRAMTITGQLLYAQDADNDGIPDRGSTDANGDGVPDVILAADPFDPASGIAFNEDVRIAEWRVVSKLAQPSRNDPDTLDGPGDFTIITDHYRWAGTLEVVIPDTSWIGDISYSFDKYTLEEPEQMQDSLSALQDGLVGDLTTVLDGETVDRYFNPFSTQAFECVNRDCSGGVAQSNPDAINAVEVLDQIATTESISQTYTLQIVDLVFSGDVFDLPNGPVRAAVGGQWRDVVNDFNEGTINNQRDSWIQFQATDWREDRTTYAAFGELDIPVFNSNMLGQMDLNIAARTEQGDDDSNADLDNTDYKIGVRWEVRPSIALRASAGTAFIAPTLEDLFASGSFGLSNISDPLFDRPATFKARSLSGNPNLKSEEADVYNVGFTLLLLEDDLAITGDWKVFFFEDRISRPIPQDVIFDDVDRFEAALAGGLVSSAEEWALNNPNLGSNANPAIGEDSRIHRNPANLLITFVETPLQNVSEMVWRGGDLNIKYNFTTIPFVGDNYGQFTAGLSATYIDSFTYKQFPDQPSKEAAGNRNNATGFVWPMPRWQGIVKLGWSMDRHSVALRGRYKHHVDEDDTLCNLPGFVLTGIKSFVGQERGTDPSRGCAEKLKSLTEWDLNYRYELDGFGFIGDRAASLEIGAINLFDTFPIPSASLGGMETFLYDPRGRQWYLRLQTEI